MINNEEKKEDIPPLRPKCKKSCNSNGKTKKSHLKIEISQIHTIEDDDFIIKENEQENSNETTESLPKMNSPSTQVGQTPNFINNNNIINDYKPELMNNNEKDTIIYRSIKELNCISHSGVSDINTSTFAQQSKKPFWPENLWKGGTLIYSYKNPEKCLGPPVLKNDKTIRFNSRFESGNLMYAYRLNPDTYHCILEYDHTPTGQCQWFYFQMTNIKTNPNPNRKTTFYISGFNKSNGVFSSGSKIFMYSEKLAKNKKISWYRAGTNYAYAPTLKKPGSCTKKDKDKKNGKNKSSKNKRSTLQFQVTFPYDDDTVYFCYAIPYTYTDLTSSIHRWMVNNSSNITHRTLCKTYGCKDCPLLTITASNSPSDVKKRCIFITSRIHPGESNGSIVLHGLIDFLLTSQPITAYLLGHFIFQIVPMINIDGVVEGYYRVGLEGDDLNRVWNNPDEVRHPVVYHTKKLMFQMNKEYGIAAYIDFHGHSRQHGTFAYGCPWDPSENLPSSFIDKEKVFPKMLAFLCDAFAFDKCVFSIPPERKDASRCVVRREMGVVNSFTIESSFGGICSGQRRNTLYVEASWKEIGAKVGEALFHLLSGDSSPLAKLIECNQTTSQSTASSSSPSNVAALRTLVQNQLESNKTTTSNEIEKSSTITDVKNIINNNINTTKENADTKKKININNINKESDDDDDNNLVAFILNKKPKVSMPTRTSENNKFTVEANFQVKFNKQESPVRPIPQLQLEKPAQTPKKRQQRPSHLDSSRTDIFDCIVELAHREIAKQEVLLLQQEAQITQKVEKIKQSNSISKNNGFKTANVINITDARMRQRSKSTVRSLTSPQNSFSAVIGYNDSASKETVKVVSSKNQKQKLKNSKAKKSVTVKNKTKPSQNLTKTYFMPTNAVASKVIKSPRLTRSMKVIKSSRINRSNSMK